MDLDGERFSIKIQYNGNLEDLESNDSQEQPKMAKMAIVLQAEEEVHLKIN